MRLSKRQLFEFVGYRPTLTIIHLSPSVRAAEPTGAIELGSEQAGATRP
jgi:hypothetical protein